MILNARKRSHLTRSCNEYYTKRNNIFLNRQNNYVGYLNWLLECQNFLQHCHQRLSVLHNYFDNPTKLFSDLYLKF